MSITRKVQRRAERRKAKSRDMVLRNEALVQFGAVHPRAPAPLPWPAENGATDISACLQWEADDRKTRNAAKRERRARR